MKEDNFYSGLKKPKKSTGGESLGEKYYDIILKAPVILFSTLIIFIILNYQKIWEFIGNDVSDGRLFILLCVITVFAAWRAHQSICLAKIDYYSIKEHWRDLLTFIAVVVFLSFSLLFGLYHKIIFLCAIYTIISLLVTINFWDLFLIRFEKQKDQLDYICEKRIQFFNVIVSSILTVLFFLTTILKARNIDAIWVYVTLAAIICVLLVLNILHSHELTYMPKFILWNNKEDDNNNSDFKKLRIGRMSKNKKDIDKIVDTIIKEFKYIFEYIFDTSDEIILKRTLRRLVTSSFGFGFLGYMNFYSIKKSDNDTEEKIDENATEVGLIKINTLHRSLIYKFLEFIYLPITIIVIIYQFGIKKLPKIYKRSKEIIDSQPKLQNKTEFELTYFVIYEEFRNNKYGICAMNLLVNALFHSKTNNINCSRLVLITRESNATFLALVKKIGLKQYRIEEDVKEPQEIIEKQGKGIFFQYSVNND